MTSCIFGNSSGALGLPVIVVSAFENTKVQCFIYPAAGQVGGLCVDGFEQLERCGSHNLNSHVKCAMSDDVNQHSDIPDLLPDGSDDEEEQSEKEDEEKEEEEEEFDSGSASGTDADYYWLTIFLHALISICFAVEEASNSDEIQSNGYRRIQPDGFDRDGYD